MPYVPVVYGNDQLYIQNGAIDASFKDPNEDNRPVVPIYFEGVRYRALLDTGCTHTIIDSSVVASHNITVHPMKGTILLGRNKVTTPRGGITTPITVECNSHERTFSMEVFDLSAYDFQIGMDRLHDFGFGIYGLPNPLPNPPGNVLIIPDKKPCIVPTEETSEPEQTPSFIKAKAKAMSYIQPALDANAAIPLDSYCPVPEMKVYLPIPSGTVIHRRQRPFAEQQQQIVDDTVHRWLNEGIVCSAPPGTSHKSPLTLAAKKDLEGSR